MYYERFDEAIGEKAQVGDLMRLHERWVNSAVDGYAPYDAFAPDQLGELTQDTAVALHVGGEELIYTYFGERRARLVGRDPTGLSLKAMDTPVSRLLQPIVLEAVTAGRAILLRHPTFRTESVHMVERLVLPCRDEEGNCLAVTVACPLNFDAELLSAVLQASPDGVWAMEVQRAPDGTIVDFVTRVINRRIAELFEFSDEGLSELTLRNTLPLAADREGEVWRMLERVVEKREQSRAEIEMPLGTGTRWLRCRAVPLGDGVVMFVRDIGRERQRQEEDERQRAALEAANVALAREVARRTAIEAELRQIAERDHLTGLPNRRAIDTALSGSFAAALRYGQALSVIVADLDAFKRINDERGHAGGDAVLRMAAELFRYGLREEIDTVGRIGGEEFCFILPHTSLESAVTLADRLRQRCASARVAGPDGRPIIFTSSFGVAEWNGKEGAADLIHRADNALYRAKGSGKNRVAVDTGEGEIVCVGPSKEASPPSLSPDSSQTQWPPAPIAEGGSDLGALFNLKGLI